MFCPFEAECVHFHAGCVGVFHEFARVGKHDVQRTICPGEDTQLMIIYPQADAKLTECFDTYPCMRLRIRLHGTPQKHYTHKHAGRSGMLEGYMRA
jgi:hypothetical protein